MAFLVAKSFGAYYHNKHSISCGDKWQNSGFVAKFLTKFALFDK